MPYKKLIKLYTERKNSLEKNVKLVLKSKQPTLKGAIDEIDFFLKALKRNQRIHQTKSFMYKARNLHEKLYAQI